MKLSIDKVNSYLGLPASIVTIILCFTQVNKIFIYIACIFVLIYFLYILRYIIITIFSIDNANNKLYDSYKNKQWQLAQKTHSYYHNLRNYSSQINSKDLITITNVREISKNICNYISEFYKQLFNDYLGNNDISVCLKIIKPKTLFDSDYMNWEMETIARSTSTLQERTNIDYKSVKISENTDFQVIISNKYNDDLFSFPNMSNINEDFPKTYDNLQYKNSRGSNFINFYKSTIVVPIKIEGNYIADSLKQLMTHSNDRNLILGFLCIDSLKSFTTQEEIDIFSIGTEYAKSIGDSLYLFFEEVLLSSINYNKI